MNDVTVVIGAGQIGQAIARRSSRESVHALAEPAAVRGDITGRHPRRWSG